jgi:hypothetical protein
MQKPQKHEKRCDIQTIKQPIDEKNNINVNMLLKTLSKYIQYY